MIASARFHRVLILLVAMLAPDLGTAQVDRGQPGSPMDELALGLDVERTVGKPNGPPLSGLTLDQKTEQLSSRMRCPVCQGNAIADSPSETARNMKRQVRAMIAAGYDDDQIIHYFEASYGEFIRLSPEPKGFNLLVWVIPILGLLLGAVVTIRMIRPRKTTGAAAQTAQPNEQANQQGSADLDPWLAEVRKQVKQDDN